jgi:glycerate kinase
MHVLIAPDKFKGTLTATTAAAIIARGWRQVRPNDHLELLPMSDGGDGFGELLGHALGAKRQLTTTTDSAGRKCRAEWWWDAKTRTAIIETAKVNGLAMLPPGKFHPFQLDTFGLGAVLRAAKRRGARNVLAGIGGSATNEGGFGMARALGWRFLDDAGKPLTRWTELHRVTRIVPPKTRRLFGRVLVASDVKNPLLGASGCSRIYGPQKGLRLEDVAEAERHLRRLADAVQKLRRNPRNDLRHAAGAGAAGGLGFGLMAFLGATLLPGFDLFAKTSGLAKRLRATDLVITGEGAIDRSSLMGKGPGELVQTCLKLRTPCLGLAGHVMDRPSAEKRFAWVGGLTDLTTKEVAMRNPAPWLEKLAMNAARTWSEREG